MFDIERITQPTSIAEALNALQADPEAVVIAGGSDVLIQMRQGKLAGRRLVSIRNIEPFKGIFLDSDGSLIVCALNTFAQVAQHPLVQQHVPTLGYACNQAGGPQLRNIGTIGGNVCNGVTSADSAATLLTLNAEANLIGPNGTRIVPLEDFYTGPGKVDMAHDELLVSVNIAKKDYQGFHGCYIKFAQRNAMDIATLGCAVHVKLSGDKKAVDEVRLAFGVAAPTPIRCRRAEAALAGQPVAPALLDQIGQLALDEVTPRTSWRATKQFRQQLVRQLSARALAESIRKAGGAL